MLSKACYVAAYRKKLTELGSLPDIDLTLVVPPYWKFGDRVEKLEPGVDRGFTTVVLNPRLNGNHHFHWYPDIGLILDQLQPDLFHIDEEPYDFVTWHAQREAAKRGIATVFFTWQNIDKNYPPPFEWIRAETMRRSDAAIAGNKEAAEILRARGFTRPLRVIPQFGVDSDDYPYQLERRSDCFRIGYAGRLWFGKGIELMLDAAATLPPGWEIQLLGAGPEEQALRRRSEKLGIADRVLFLGSRPSTEVSSFLHDIDVLVLPSLTQSNWKEQFGRILIEAMACGTPVVGSNSGEIPNVIGDAGGVFPEGDAAALRSILSSLMADPALRASYAERGRRRVLENFTQKAVAEHTAELYRYVKGVRAG